MTIPYHLTVEEPCSREEVQKLIDDAFAQIDATVNNWNPHSEVSTLNQLPPGKLHPISAELATLLTEAGKVVEQTDGLFDPTIGSVQKLWRERLEQQTIPSTEELHALKRTVGWKKLHLQGHTVWKESPLTLDLGGIAKGYAVDLLTQKLKESGYQNFLVCWGGEVFAAGHHPSSRPWQVATPDGVRPLTNEALATSGDSEQYWVTPQGTYTHICHPKTLQAVHIKHVGKSISLVAPTCLEADGLATAHYLVD